MTDINKEYPPLATIPFKARQKTDLVVVHCADTPPSMDIGAREINQWHVRDNGWSAIGYHFVIRRDGTIEGGRPVGAIGAHAALVNSRSVGICMVGGKGKPGTIDDHFTKEQQLSLVVLLKQLKGLYPTAEVVGHRNVDNAGKTCPQFDAKTWAATVLP
jgi:N-acetyl-anhydromuramyl-L-alanine amidase AmpD